MKRFAIFCMTILLLAALTACGAKPDTAQPDGGAELPAKSAADPRPPEEPAPAEPPAEEPEDPATEVEGPHDALLRRYYTLVADPDSVSDIFADGEFGVIQDAWFLEDDALDAVGYAITDISGDGIPELVVGLLPEYGGYVDAVYTLVDGEPRFVLEGWPENSYSYIGDGTFYYYGYGWSDVWEAGQGFFALTEDGTELVCQEFYFTRLQEEELSDVPVYTNTTGSWEPSKSQETEMSSEDFWAWEPEYEKLPMTPFSAFDFVRAEPQVSVRLAPEGGDYDEVVLDDGPSSCRLLFTADSAVEYFTLLELTLEDAAEDGIMEFTDYPAVLNTPLDTLSPEQPVVVQLVLGENIPNYGIAYVDTHGDMRRFALECSGMDGSILLQETDPDCFGFVIRGGE